MVPRWHLLLQHLQHQWPGGAKFAHLYEIYTNGWTSLLWIACHWFDFQCAESCTNALNNPIPGIKRNWSNLHLNPSFCLLRCVHTMPRGRMQHTAALPRGKSCSVYAANAIASTWKKNFLQTFFRLPKLWNKIGELGLIFFSNWLIPFWKPLRYVHTMPRGTQLQSVARLRGKRCAMSQVYVNGALAWLWHAGRCCAA